MGDFLMPSLGADMEHGTLVSWSVRVGDRVEKGQVVAEVETEKGLAEVESFESGVVEALLVEPGTTVPVGQALARIGTGAPAPAQPSARSRVSPLARRRARELGIDPDTLAGTGPEGSVTVADVERAQLPGGLPPTPSAPPPPAAPEDRAVAMRRVIGAAMSRSKREIPHYYLATTVDVHDALARLTARNETKPAAERLLPAVLFVRAVALALRDFPEFNARTTEAGPRPQQGIHVGVAVALRGGGLVAPAIHDTDRLDYPALMEALRDLVTRVRAGSWRSSEMSDGTITLTSLGERGVETVYPVIYPPQVAIVGIGSVVERPWVHGGSVVPRRIVQATLAADHRASDGHRGAAFLARFAELLSASEGL